LLENANVRVPAHRHRPIAERSSQVSGGGREVRSAALLRHRGAQDERELTEIPKSSFLLVVRLDKLLALNLRLCVLKPLEQQLVLIRDPLKFTLPIVAVERLSIALESRTASR